MICPPGSPLVEMPCAAWQPKTTGRKKDKTAREKIRWENNIISPSWLMFHISKHTLGGQHTPHGAVNLDRIFKSVRQGFKNRLRDMMTIHTVE